MKNKAWMTAYPFMEWLLEYFKSTVETYCSEKYIPFKIFLLTDNASSPLRAQIEMYWINVVVMLANITSMLEPADQEVMLTFKSYYLRNAFCSALPVVIPGDSSGRSWHSALKALRNDSPS